MNQLLETDLMAPTEALVVSPEALISERVDSPEWQAINRWEQEAAKQPQVRCPLDHVFTPGLYTRIIFMPKGTKVTSKIHLLEHPYIIAAGVVDVWTLETGRVRLQAPHVGVTMPATRRVLEIVEDTIWITSHVNPDNERDPEKIIERITYDHMKLGHMDSVSPEHLAALIENQKGEHP